MSFTQQNLGPRWCVFWYVCCSLTSADQAVSFTGDWIQSYGNQAGDSTAARGYGGTVGYWRGGSELRCLTRLVRAGRHGENWTGYQIQRRGQGVSQLGSLLTLMCC